MSSVHPPGSPVPFLNPCAANAPFGFGHVVSVAAMNASIANGPFSDALEKDVPVVLSVHVVASGDGEVRFTSFCSRQGNFVPAWLTCNVCAGSAFDRPSTPSHPP